MLTLFIMNIEKRNNKYIKFEGIWRKNKNEIKKDFNNKLYPIPIPRKKQWKGQKKFLKKLIYIQNLPNRRKEEYEEKNYKHCYIDGEPNISTLLYFFGSVAWEDSLYHYVSVHNVKPTKEFYDFIMEYKYDPRKSFRTINKLITLTTDQLNYIDAILYYGIDKKVFINNKGKYVLRDTIGYIKINENGIQYVTIEASDSKDNINLEYTGNIRYEIFFQTKQHNILSKSFKDGIFYNIPDIQDIYLFIYNYTENFFQICLVNTYEGIYMIKRKHPSKNISNISQSSKQKISDAYDKIQKKAISKYSNKLKKQNDNFFYTVILQDTTFIDDYNKILDKYNIYIKFLARIKNKKGIWTNRPIELSVAIPVNSDA